MYRLVREEDSATGARRILREKVDETISLLDTSGNDLDKAVHSARKNMKRIRAVLRLVRDETGEPIYKRENICYRDAARQLAPLRDSAVMVETLDRVKKQFAADLESDAFAGIRKELVARQMAIREYYHANQQVVSVVVDILHKARHRIDTLPLVRTDFEAYRGGLRRVYRRGRRRMARAYADPANAEKFHDWRKRVKYLWYQMEILGPLWPPVQAERANELHELSNYLGDAHDLVVLCEVLTMEAERFADEPDVDLLLALCGRFRQELEAAARPLGDRMYVERPSSFVERMAVYWRVWRQDAINGVQRQERKTPQTKSAVDLMGTGEAAARLGISAQQVRRRIAAGHLDAFKVGRVWAIPAEAVAEAEHENGTG